MDFENKLDKSLNTDLNKFFKEFIEEAARKAGLKKIFVFPNPVKYPDDVSAMQLHGSKTPTDQWAALDPILLVLRLKTNNVIQTDEPITKEVISIANIDDPDSMDKLAGMISQVS